LDIILKGVSAMVVTRIMAVYLVLGINVVRVPIVDKLWVPQDLIIIFQNRVLQANLWLVPSV
jgi:hypothetical protein